MTHSPDADGSSTGHGPGPSGHAVFGPQWWEEHHGGHEAAPGAASPHLVAELAGLPAGTALDAGCGTGADAVWLARQGWEVTAVDISPTAVSRAERLAADQAPDVAPRIAWLVADLTTWEPPRRYDLVVSQYVHPGVPFAGFVARLAGAVGPGGTLFVAGHDHADEHSAAHAPEQASIGPEAVVSSLDPDHWEIDVAGTRTRRGPTDSIMHDLVVRARRKAAPRTER